MTNRENERLKGMRELTNHEMKHVQGAGGWGMAQYQYGFEGTYYNSVSTGRTEGNLTTKLRE